METLGQRLQARMDELGISPAEVARRAQTTEATIHNWLKNKVRTDHVKAFQLFNISDAVGADPRSLLLGSWSDVSFIHDAPDQPYVSQPLKPETLTLAFQLAAEVVERLRTQNRTLPPSKQAEIANLAYDLLSEDLPRAKVLRFVLAAAA